MTAIQFLFGISPITVTSAPFAGLLLVLVVAGWSRVAPPLYATLVAVCGGVLALSWLDLRSGLVLLAALAPGWFFTRYSWGRADRSTMRTIFLFVSWQVLVLAATKLGSLSQSLGIPAVVGLSYVTFRQIHLFLEAPRQTATPFRTVHWFSYLLNPWTLLAGPIQNWTDHERGFAELTRPNADETLTALHRIATGLLKVLIFAPLFRNQGDLQPFVDQALGWRDIVSVFYGYYIFLFLDFSGYTDIVLGAARLAGYRTLPENFRRPYLATNLQDFWARWNITLGLWFRTHVFTPLFAILLRRWGIERQDSALALSLFAIFVLIGLWHGVSWNYALFGIFHAIGVTSVFLLRQAAVRRWGGRAVKSYERNRWLLPVRIVLCQHAVAVSFLLLDNQVLTLLRVAGWAK